jgi:hypothetical protein
MGNIVALRDFKGTFYANVNSLRCGIMRWEMAVCKMPRFDRSGAHRGSL